MPDAGQDFYHDHCPQQAAGIAYRVLFSIVPLAIVLVSIFGLVLQDDAVRKDVVDAIVRHLPVTVAGRKDVENALTSIATPLSAAGLLSLALFAWAATGMMAGIRFGLETAMHVTESRPTFRGKAVDLLLVVGAGLLFFFPRRLDAVRLAALTGALLVGFEITLSHWFYLYIPWFFPVVMVALLGRYATAPVRVRRDAASAPARSSRPEAVLSS